MQTRQELYDLLEYSDYEARDREYFSGAAGRADESVARSLRRHRSTAVTS